MGFFSSCLADGLKYGFTSSICYKISMSSGEDFGKNSAIDLSSFFRSKTWSTNFNVSSCVTKEKSDFKYMVLNLLRILQIWSESMTKHLSYLSLTGDIGKQDLPWNNYYFSFSFFSYESEALISSPRMMPALQISLDSL